MRYLFLCIILSSLESSAQVCSNPIWFEDFESYSNGTQNAPDSKWTTSANNCDADGPPGTENGNYWGVFDGEFRVNDIEGLDCCASGGGDQGEANNEFITEFIDISGYAELSVSMKTRVTGDVECSSCGSGGDLLSAQWEVDGGGWNEFHSICGAVDGFVSLDCADIPTGNQLQIRILVGNQANDENYFIDDIYVCALACNEICSSDVVADISVTGDNPLCSNNLTCSEITIDVGGGTGPYEVIYTDGTTNFTLGSGSEPAGSYSVTICPTETTTYSIVSTYDIGESCFGNFTDPVVVEVTEMILNSISPTFCEESFGTGQVSNVDMTQFNASIYSGGDDYTWVGGNTQTISDGDVTNVTVQDGTCLEDIDITFIVNSLPDADILGDTIICSYDELTPLTIDFTSGSAPWEIELSDGTTFTTSEDPYQFTPASAGTYSITSITDGNGCFNGAIDGSATISVNSVEASFEADPESGDVPLEVVFTNLSTGNNLEYDWDFGNGNTSNEENSVNTYEESGTFDAQLIIMDSIGCRDTLSQQIEVFSTSSVEIPNVFTPGNDGKNDYFKPKSVNMKTERLQIFNRWGKLLFEDNEVGVKWDGMFNGKPVSEGTYYYIYSATGNDGKEYKAGLKGEDECKQCKGSLQLIRK